MVQATGKSSGHGVNKIITFKKMLRSLKELLYFSSQTSTLIIPTVHYISKSFGRGAWGPKMRQILSPTFEIVPRFVPYINYVVLLTLLMTHFMNYVGIKHIRRG